MTGSYAQQGLDSRSFGGGKCNFSAGMPGDFRHRAIQGQRARWHYWLGVLYPSARPERTIPFPGGPVRLRPLCCVGDTLLPCAVDFCDRSPIGPLPGGDADKVPARMIENADTMAVSLLVVFMDFVLSVFGLSAPHRGNPDGTKGGREGHWWLHSSQVHAYSGLLHPAQVLRSSLIRKFFGLASAPDFT